MARFPDIGRSSRYRGECPCLSKRMSHRTASCVLHLVPSGASGQYARAPFSWSSQKCCKTSAHATRDGVARVCCLMHIAFLFCCAAFPTIHAHYCTAKQSVGSCRDRTPMPPPGSRADSRVSGESPAPSPWRTPSRHVIPRAHETAGSHDLRGRRHACTRPSRHPLPHSLIHRTSLPSLHRTHPHTSKPVHVERCATHLPLFHLRNLLLLPPLVFPAPTTRIQCTCDCQDPSSSVAVAFTQQ